MHVETILNPADVATLPQRDLGGSVCVVFDVLRATSTMLTAFFNGARRIHPAATIEEARERHRDGAPETLLGGERGGVRIEGFHLGNSPREYTHEAVGDREIVMTTTNGTVALRACAGAGQTLVGALLNLDALAVYLNQPGQDVGRVLLVCAGTGNLFALEDGFGAGGLLARLSAGNAGLSCDDASLSMLALWRDAGHDPLRALQSSANGRKLMELGLGPDVERCAQISMVPLVAILRNGALEAQRIEAQTGGFLHPAALSPLS